MILRVVCCVAAIVTCAGRMPAIAADTVASFPFAYACFTRTGHATAVTPYGQFHAWTDRYASIAGPEPMTKTSVVDPIRLAFSTSLHYLSRAGDIGKDDAEALYDPGHRVLAICVTADGWTSLALVANVRPPPFAVVHADLASVATQHGIHLGSSIADVEAVYGRSRLVPVRGRPPQLSYLRLIQLPNVDGYRQSPEAVETWFAILGGRVASMSLGAGF